MKLVAPEFTRWWCYQLKTYDCDPALFMMQYLMSRFELNTEQRYWFCWIYANTYQVATAWVIFNEFPDFENVNVDRLRAWNEANKSALPYQKDQKWHRGQLARNFEAYREACPMGQSFMWDCAGNNFNAAWRMLLSPDFPGFGRYTSWFYLQALNECCGHSFKPESMFLGEDSCAMPKAGLESALGLHPNDCNAKWYLDKLEAEAELIIHQATLFLFDDGVEGALPVEPDRFSLETSLCSWAKVSRGAPKGRYLGYYLDRMAEDIANTAKWKWEGINWTALWQGRHEILHPMTNCTSGVRPEYMNYYPNAGIFTGHTELLEKLDAWWDARFQSVSQEIRA